jgi:pilus assembly protein Flp/PilA
MKNLFARFVKNESGATAIEYGLIAALVGIAIIAGATLLGGALNTTFTNVGTTLNENNAAP